MSNTSKGASPAPSNEYDTKSSSADDQSDNEPPVVSLVTGREKRATAGNRLSSLLENEGDDELQLLFAEDEEGEDIEFEGEDEDASDAELDSSSDEEDQGSTKGDGDLAGEKELQKQDRLERQKKRKAQDVFKKPAVLRKKVKIDPSAMPTTPAPRPKKKSERVSWVHTEADAPTRTSSRKQTVQNREVVHQRLVDSEQTRLKVMQSMEEAQKRKDAMKPKALTQADRMEEAARTERKNAKSLNRWEESEKKRSEEQRAKLEALHNRQLTGPVVSWWSGLARWVNGKIGQLGVKEIRDAGYRESPTTKEDGSPNASTEKPPQSRTSGHEDDDIAIPGVLHPHHLTESSGQLTLPHGQQTSAHQQYTFAPPQGPYGFLDGIHAYAALPMHHQQTNFTGNMENKSITQSYQGPAPPTYYNYGSFPPIPLKPPVPSIEYTSRDLVALKNMDANALKLPELQSSILLKDKKKGVKLQSMFLESS